MPPGVEENMQYVLDMKGILLVFPGATRKHGNTETVISVPTFQCFPVSSLVSDSALLSV